MKTTIFYFSATGNSLSVAKKIIAELDDAELVAIPEALKTNRIKTDAERVGFVFPLHYFGLPMLVEDFIRKADFGGAKYIFAVVTCGMPNLGSCFHDLSALLGGKDKILHASWYVRMISSYVKLRDIPRKEEQRKIFAAADKKVAVIKEDIIHNRRAATSEFFAWPLRVIHKKWYSRRETLANDFTVDTTKCISCSRCQRVCPVNNISLQDGHPVWQSCCTECLGCLHICPQQAINCGEKTKTRSRYRNPDIEAEELMRKF